MSESGGEQIHPATPTRLEQARNDGEFAKSHELAGAIQLLGGLVVLFLLAGGVAAWLLNWTRETWTTAINSSVSETLDRTVEQSQQLGFSFLGVIAPLLTLFLLFAVLAHWIQTGPFFSTKMVAPRAERLSPAGWFKRFFSSNVYSQPLVGLPKAIVCLAIACWICWASRTQFWALSTMPVEQLVDGLFGLVLKVSLAVAATLFVFALIDYAMQRIRFAKRMRMTDQQLRDEMRMQNGDPQIQTRQRQAHQSFTRRV